jgi:hypothetical protein
MLSGAPDPAMEERARKGEIVALLRKPMDTEALFRAVQAAMDKTPRRNIRIAAYLPAVLEDGGPAAEGVVSVLSEYGMFFRTLEPRALHARVPVSMSLPKGPAHLEAQVLYTYAFKEGPFREPGMGMKFVTINEDARLLIRSYILEQVESGLKNSGCGT